MKNSLPQALFISHGGGPLPLLGDAAHQQMVTCLQEIAGSMPRPEAILVVSAHWEEPVPTLTAAAQPSLIYDYYGFPQESYRIEYACAGAPSLAEEIQLMLARAGFDAGLDPTRGLDHGVFVPLKIMYPQADIPCVQLSLVSSLDSALHIDLGAALRGLAKNRVLVIGSGFSFHNLAAFFSNKYPDSHQLNESFEKWLRETCNAQQLSEARRRNLLVNWERAPGARFCHPREEHLLPLHLCYGVAGGACSEWFELTIMRKQSSMFMW